jgi:hypothetical protein
MKKLFFLLLVGLILSACSEKSVLNEPQSKNEISFIQIPKAADQFAKTVTFSEVIDGSVGGSIDIEHSYTAANGVEVEISGKLEIPAAAFQGTKNIVISLDDEFAVINFYPSPYQFALPLKLDLKYKGLNLNGIDKANFFYISDDGNRTEPIRVQSNLFNRNDGTIGIIKAELNHFSRFGWVI